MRNIGALLIGWSLLTLAIVITLSKVAEAIFLISRNTMYVTPNIVYILISAVFLLGVFLIFIKNTK